MASDAERAEAGRRDAERATRRQFFRHLGRQTASGAGSVMSSVEALRRSSQQAVDGLLGADDQPRSTVGRQADERGTVPRPAGPPPTDAPFRSPYRFTGQALEILDQRRLPRDATVLECRSASEVAAAIRHGALSGGPVLAQVAAYALLLAAEQSVGRSAYTRRAAVDGAADTLSAARPTSRAIGWAIEQMQAAAAGVEDEDAALELAALRAAADAIAADAAVAHARLGQLGADALAARTELAVAEGRPLALLMHGDLGPLAGGQVGPGLAVVQALAARGQQVDVWLTEAAPLLEGRRAAWALRQLGVAHTLVPDTALAWLLANRTVDVLLLRAEWVCANGDVVAPLGSLAAAQLAQAAGVPVHACAPSALFDPATADGSAVPAELRPPPIGDDAATRLDPVADVVPAALLDGILSEHGLLAPVSAVANVQR